MNLTNDDVVEILKILDDSPYDELSVTTGRFTLTLSRSGSGGWVQESVDEPREDAAQAAEATPADGNAAGPDVAQESGVHNLRPPLPGTFYRAPKPGAGPFVEVGDRVQPDTTVGIVETMKLMNSVPAGVAGEVVAIVTDNGSMVGPGDVLMQIRVDDA